MTMNRTLVSDERCIRITFQNLDTHNNFLDQLLKNDDRKTKQRDNNLTGHHDPNKHKSDQNQDRLGKIRTCLQSYLPALSDDTNKFPKLKTNPKPDSPLLIIGAGQMRTGTTSLKQALEILYQKPCYHMSRVVYELKQPHIRKWVQAFRRTDRLKLGEDFESVLPKQFWNSIFDGYVAAVDYPTCAFYKDLMHIYPEAKIILTVREPNSWVSSCRATTASNLVMRKPTISEWIINLIRGIRSLPELHHRMFKRSLGKGYARFSDDSLRQKFVEWNEQVIKTVPPERLLVYDVNQGWEPLCKFLDLPLPDPSIKFPHLNKRHEIVRVLTKYRQMERFLEVVLTFILFSGVFMLFYFLYIFY